MGKLIDLTGRTYGQLTVLSRAENGASGQSRWNVLCSCGVEKAVHGSNLTTGDTKSCGHLRVENGKRLAAMNKALWGKA